ITHFESLDPFLSVQFKSLDDEHGDPFEEEAMMRQLVEQFGKYSKFSQKLSKETVATVADIDNPSQLTYIIASHLPLKTKEKQVILEIDHVMNRMRHLLKLITDEKKVLDLEHKIGKRVQSSMEQTQKEYYL